MENIKYLMFVLVAVFLLVAFLPNADAGFGNVMRVFSQGTSKANMLFLLHLVMSLTSLAYLAIIRAVPHPAYPRADGNGSQVQLIMVPCMLLR